MLNGSLGLLGIKFNGEDDVVCCCSVNGITLAVGTKAFAVVVVVVVVIVVVVEETVVVVGTVVVAVVNDVVGIIVLVVWTVVSGLTTSIIEGFTEFKWFLDFEGTKNG